MNQSSINPLSYSQDHWSRKEHLEENSIKEHIRRIRLLVPTTTLVRADAVAAMERSFLNSGDDGEKGALQTRQQQRAVLPLTGNAIEDHQPPAGADDGVVWLDPLLTRLGPQSDGDCTYTRTCASTLTYTLLYYITSAISKVPLDALTKLNMNIIVNRETVRSS